MHAAVRIGNAILEMGEAPDEQFLPARFLLYVEECDASYDHAIAAGATSIEKPADYPYGQRKALILDPFGYEWAPASNPR